MSMFFEGSRFFEIGKMPAVCYEANRVLGNENENTNLVDYANLDEKEKNKWSNLVLLISHNEFSPKGLHMFLLDCTKQDSEKNKYPIVQPNPDYESLEKWQKDSYKVLLSIVSALK